MSTLTDALHAEHREFEEEVERIRRTARDVPVFPPAERTAAVAGILEFLDGRLVPHAKREERELYPKVGRLLGHPDATAPMIYDHVAVRERALDLADTDPSDVARLQELLYGLYALVSVHLWKEEELYLPLVERSPAVAA